MIFISFPRCNRGVWTLYDNWMLIIAESYIFQHPQRSPWNISVKFMWNGWGRPIIWQGRRLSSLAGDSQLSFLLCSRGRNQNVKESVVYPGAWQDEDCALADHSRLSSDRQRWQKLSQSLVHSARLGRAATSGWFWRRIASFRRRAVMVYALEPW
jgi:hypothetical protein